MLNTLISNQSLYVFSSVQQVRIIQTEQYMGRLSSGLMKRHHGSNIYDKTFILPIGSYSRLSL